jgi:hypothetical protein
VWEVNQGDVPSFIRSQIAGTEDPLVVLAPLNPFNTEVQVWLSRNDPAYQPLYIDNQENLEECDDNVRPSYDQLSLDVTSIYAPPTPEVSSPTNFLEDTVPISVSETDQAVVSITPYVPESTVPEPTMSETALFFDDVASDFSSLLEDHSETIAEVIQPPEIVMEAAPEEIDPDFQELVDLFNNPAMLPVEMREPTHAPPAVQVHLNMNTNPHANLVTPEFENNDLPDLPRHSPEPPVGQAHVSVDDLFYPMMDITNLPM